MEMSPFILPHRTMAHNQLSNLGLQVYFSCRVRGSDPTDKTYMTADLFTPMVDTPVGVVIMLRINLDFNTLRFEGSH